MSLFRNRSLLSFAAGHFIVDFFSGMLPILVAAHTAPLALTQGQIGLIALAYSLSTSLAQPLFGLLADGAFAPRLALLGIVWQVGLMGAAGYAPRFEVLLGLVALGGLGSAAFHPPGAGSVPRLTDPTRRGGAMSVFLLGGNSGYAIGPLVAGVILNAHGPRGVLALTIGAALVLPLLALALIRLRYPAPPMPASALAEPAQPRRPLAAPAAAPTAAIAALALIVIARSWASASLTTYLPQYLLQQGQNVAFAGNALFVLSALAALGGFSAGFLSDRVGIRRIVIGTLLLSVPLMASLRLVSGFWLMIALGAAGFFLLASLPLTLLLGQDLFPGRPGVMAGLTLGFTFVAGGIGAAVTGAVAERIGLTAVFTWLPVLPLLGGVCAAVLYAFPARPAPAAAAAD